MRKAAVWIDHRKAVVAVIDAGQESLQVIEGNEPAPGPPGSRRTSTPYGPQAHNLDRQREEKARHQHHAFYQEVLRVVGKPEQLLVMGPAEAKREFAGLVERSPATRGTQIKVEPADRMTEAQIAARLRAFEG